MVTVVAAVIVLTVGSVAETAITREGSLFVGLSVPVGLLVAAGYFLAIGVLEELIFRGYVLVNLAEGARIALDSRRAVLLGLGMSAALFGAAHAGNPNATALSTLNIALFGLLLGGGYVLTDSLAVPIGIHTGWNFVLGPIFGLPVSGLTTSIAVVAIDYDQSAALTGGGFGPEGSVLALAALLVGTAILALWLRYTSGLSVCEQIAEPDLWTRSS
jgi:membrane protease YdiL (CAAX protease family)